MSNSAFELIAVCAIVVSAAGYLGVLFFKRLRAGKDAGGCGGACSCPLKKPDAGAGKPGAVPRR